MAAGFNSQPSANRIELVASNCFFLSETLEGPAGFIAGGAFVYLYRTTVHATTTP